MKPLNPQLSVSGSTENTRIYDGEDVNVRTGAQDVHTYARVYIREEH